MCFAKRAAFQPPLTFVKNSHCMKAPRFGTAVIGFSSDGLTVALRLGDDGLCLIKCDGKCFIAAFGSQPIRDGDEFL